MDGQNYGAIQQFLANQGARRVANFQAGSQAVDHGMTNFLYRLIFGPMSRPGDGSPGALAQSFNPLHPAGLVNDLSMFVGGGDMPEGFAREMPGQFERYDLSKSPATDQFDPFSATKDRSKITNQGREGGISYRLNREGAMRQAKGNYEQFTSPAQREAIARKYGIQNADHAVQRIRYLMDNAAAIRAREAHDHMFGGEVHAIGPIPHQPHVPEFRPDNTRAEDLIHEARLRDRARMQESVDKFNATRETGPHAEHSPGYIEPPSSTAETLRRVAEANRRDPHGHEFDAAAEQLRQERDAAHQAKQRAIDRLFFKHNLMDPSEVGFRHLKGFTGLGSREHGYSGSQEFNTHLHDAEDFGSRHDAKANLLHSLMRRHYQPRDFYSGHNRMN